MGPLFTLGSNVTMLARLRMKEAELYAALSDRINRLSLQLQQKIQNDKLSGQVLNQRSGTLKRSIEMIPSFANTSAGTVMGGVRGAGGPAFYGRFHEFGTDRSYTIVPVTKQALRFYVNGKVVFAARVQHPPIKERSFMRSAASEMEPEIISAIEATVLSVLSAQPATE